MCDFFPTISAFVYCRRDGCWILSAGVLRSNLTAWFDPWPLHPEQLYHGTKHGRTTWGGGGGVRKSPVCAKGLSVSRRRRRRRRNAGSYCSCRALGVVFRRLLYQHRGSRAAYPAAKVQARHPQGNQTMPNLQTATAEQSGEWVHTLCLQRDYSKFTVLPSANSCHYFCSYSMYL